MIVVDASAAVSALINAGPARTALSIEQLHAPHLIDIAVANALRRQVARDMSTPLPGGRRWRPWESSA